MWIQRSILEMFEYFWEICYRILICFRKLFLRFVLWRMHLGRFYFGTAGGSSATGVNSGLLNLSQFNMFFQFCRVLYNPPFF